MKGKVKFYNRAKRFGFIKGEDEKEYFVHASQIKDEAVLNENDDVDFEPSTNDKGLAATEVKKV